MSLWAALDKKAKIAIGVFACAYTAQTIGGLVVLGHHEKEMAKYRALSQGSLYLMSILERENVELTEFDALALEAMRPNLKKKKGES